MASQTPEEEGPEPEVLLEGEEFRQVFDDWQARLRSTLQPGENWALVGIKRRGAILARRLYEAFAHSTTELHYGEVDISLYRDDYHLQHNQPRVLGTEIEFPLDGCRIILVDDVLFSGRTVRAAIEQILDYGRPLQILLATLIDRGHRELPIAADFVGREVRTDRTDRILVRLEELDPEGDRVLLSRKALPRV